MLMMMKIDDDEDNDDGDDVDRNAMDIFVSALQCYIGSQEVIPS